MNAAAQMRTARGPAGIDGCVLADLAMQGVPAIHLIQTSGGPVSDTGNSNADGMAAFKVARINLIDDGARNVRRTSTGTGRAVMNDTLSRCRSLPAADDHGTPRCRKSARP